MVRLTKAVNIQWFTTLGIATLNWNNWTITNRINLPTEEGFANKKMAAIVKSTYQNDLLLFKITNDRGLVSSELAPLFSKNQFIEVHYIIRMIRIKEIESLSKNSFERKLVVSRKYSCEEQVTLIEKYYDSIISLFSEDQFDDTIKRIYKL